MKPMQRVINRVSNNINTCELVYQYLKDPDCSPKLWIANKEISGKEKRIFLELVKHYTK